MKTAFAHLALLALSGLSLRAVYAPIPEDEQGRGFTAQVAAGVHHDSNIFGAATDEIDSMVYQVAPTFAFNASATPRTFVSARYKLILEHMTDRPGDRTIDSHEASVRLAHSFRPDTTLDLTESYQVLRNPESLLAGVPINTDQSFKRNQLDARFDTKVNPRLVATAKARATHYAFDNDNLARSLDRDEWLLGAAAAYAVLPETSVVGEVRYQEIGYDAGSAQKDKDSRFLLLGFNYDPTQKLSARLRAGWEDRKRRGEAGKDAPYAEASLKYDYGEASFVSGGYSYALEETSNLDLYTDSQVHRLFVNVQHFVSPVVAASTSLNFEPAVLQGRRGVSPNQDEDTVRLGFALTYLGRRDWSVSATFDHDRVTSDDAARELKRTRVGLSGRYSF
jgi:hypothetical protein